LKHSSIVTLTICTHGTEGDAHWISTNSEARTGNYSIQPGNIGDNQSFTLEINLDLLSDTSIEFDFKASSGVLKWTYQSNKSTIGKSPGIWFDNIYFPGNSVNLTSIKTDESKPFTFDLFHNYPNPFNLNTLLKYSLTTQSRVKLSLYDFTGWIVKDLFLGL